MKIENTASAHNPTLSIAKALCIILMVVGHSGCPAYLHDWIYLFHMPCFFLISGYLLKDRYIDNLKLAVRKRLKVVDSIREMEHSILAIAQCFLSYWTLPQYILI